MITVYVISSLKKRFRYVGITKDLEERLSRHNAGRSKSTRSFFPLKLIYKEEYPNYQEARKREKFLKGGVGRDFPDTLEY